MIWGFGVLHNGVIIHVGEWWVTSYSGYQDLKALLTTQVVKRAMFPNCSLKIMLTMS